MLKKKYLFYFLCFVLPRLIYSQNDLSVDDFVFVCEDKIESIENKLRSGINAFFLEIEETETAYVIKNAKPQRSLGQVLNNIKKFLKNDTQTIISLVFKGELDEQKLQHFLNNIFFEKCLFHKKTEWPKIKFLQDKGIQVFAVLESQIASTSIQRIRSENKYENRFSSDPLDKLVLYNSSARMDTILLNNTLELWKCTGKAPNFILASEIQIEAVKKIADSLNSKRRFRGIAEYNGNLLNAISWVKSPKSITPAKFSFPLTETEQVLSPYKNGYRITPAEVIHHVGQNDAPRIFSAYNIDIKDKLIYDFSFENRIENAVERTWDRFISKNVSIVNDSERGRVLYFNSNDSFIDYSKENTLNFETPISIAAWVKPHSIPHYMGILGFGMAFSLKLRDGNPDFTMATVKDHIIEQPLKINEWQHLVVVYNPKATVEFYLDGERIGEADAHNIIPSKQSLVIGNNIWGEQFHGSIDDLKIWNRGLSQKEITTLFQHEPKRSNLMVYVIIGAFVFFGSVFVFLYKRKKSSVKPHIKSQQDSEYLKQPRPKQNTLYLFGNFRIDLVSEKALPLSFSPLHKQLLSFLILATLEEKDGVSTNKLTETFWPGVSKMKAKENRNGNIRKLRKALSKIEGLEVVFTEKKWRIINTENFEIDIFQYIKLKKSIEHELRLGKLILKDLEAFIELLKRGNILQNIQTEWVDYFKNRISNEVENLLSKIYNDQKKHLYAELNIKIAKTILLFDSLNENALKILIRELVSSGKHGLAQSAYTTFSKNYEMLYAEPFRIEYQSFVKK